VVHKRRGKVAWLEQVTAEQYEGRFDASRLMKKYAKGDRQTDRDVLPCSHRLSEEPWHAWTRRTNHDMFSDLSPEQRVRPDQPPRAIRTMTAQVLRELSPRFRNMGGAEEFSAHG